MRFITTTLMSIGLALTLIIPHTAEAVDSDPDSVSSTAVKVTKEPGTQKPIDEIALEMSNPLASFTSLSYRFDFVKYQGSIEGAGELESQGNIVQAVIPFAQKNGKGFVLRAALPYIGNQPIYATYQNYSEWVMRQVDPTLDADGEWTTTHGHTDDLITDLVYGGVSDTGFILQYGLAGRWPTSSDTSNARQQLILGPEVNIGKRTEWGQYGALISHVIDIAEKRDKGTPDTTVTTIEAYFSYALSRGWQLYSSPVISYDWEGDSGNKLAVPLGGGFAKTTRIGRTPLRLSAEVQKYVASTDRFGPDWLFKFTITPVFPNKYTRY